MADIMSSCDLYKKIVSMSVLDKNSASHTEIIISVVKLDNKEKKNVIAKIFPNILDFPPAYRYDLIINTLNSLHTNLGNYASGVSGLIYEMATYKIITENILNMGYSQNFIRCIGSGYCNYDILGINIGSKLAMSYGIKYNEELNTLKHYFNPLKVGIIFTEKIGGLGRNVMTLFDFLGSNKAEYETYKKQVVFQIIHALSIMETLKIQHNDLHAGNILVEELKEEQSFIYYSNTGKSYTIHTKYVPYVYDWDFAYVEKLGPNVKLTTSRACLDSTACNIIDPYFDLYTVFCTLRGFYEPSYLKSVYDSITDNENGDELLFARDKGFFKYIGHTHPQNFYKIGNNLKVILLDGIPALPNLLKEFKTTDRPLKGDVLLYDSNIGRIKEGIFLNQTEYKDIHSSGVFVADGVYKFIPSILNMCLSEEKYKKFFGDEIKSFIVKIHPTTILGYSGILEKAKGFKCRPTQYLKSMPKPTQLLDAVFNEFIASENELKTIQDVYRFPQNTDIDVPRKSIYTFSDSGVSNARLLSLPSVANSKKLAYNPKDLINIQSGTKSKTPALRDIPEEEQSIQSPSTVVIDDVPLGIDIIDNVWYNPMDVQKLVEVQKPVMDAKKPPPFRFNPSEAKLFRSPLKRLENISPIKQSKFTQDFVNIDLDDNFDDNKSQPHNPLATPKVANYARSINPRSINTKYKPSSRATKEFNVYADPRNTKKKHSSGYEIVNYEDQGVFVLDEDQNFSVNT